jgi:hypothetical protein
MRKKNGSKILCDRGRQGTVKVTNAALFVLFPQEMAQPCRALGYPTIAISILVISRVGRFLREMYVL